MAKDVREAPAGLERLQARRPVPTETIQSVVNTLPLVQPTQGHEAGLANAQHPCTASASPLYPTKEGNTVQPLLTVAGIPLPDSPRERARAINLTWLPSFTVAFDSFVERLGPGWNRSNTSQYLLGQIMAMHEAMASVSPGNHTGDSQEGADTGQRQ